MRGSALLELALDACPEVVDVLRGRKRQLAAVFLARVLLLSPETYVSVAAIRATAVTDALTEHILQSRPEHISVRENVADPAAPRAS